MLRTTRHLGAVLLCAAAFAGACGGNKGKAATPTSGSGKTTSTDPSMKDIDPGMPPSGGGGGNGGADANLPVPTGTGTGAAGSNAGPTGPTAPPEPVVQMPNFDPDPAQAKSAVDQHLVVARASIAAPTPDPETALREARAALAIDASSVEAAAMVGFAYYHKKLYDTAELVLDDVIKREVAKSNANIYYVYGLVYDKTNRPAQATLAFTKAVELNGNFASALVNLGMHQLMNQQYTAAQATFEKLTQQLTRTDAVTLTSLGSAYRGRASEYPATAGEHDQMVRAADAAYKRAIQVNVNYGPAYYNLGLLYLDNDPFPGIPDALQRLNMSKDFFEKYKQAPGFDLKLHADRIKDVDKAIKKASKKAKAAKPTP